MAIKKFNSIDGFSVGSDTPIAVIDNVANVSANSLVVANKSNLGNVGNITITGGSSGYVLQTDGSGNLIFVNPSSTGVAGSNTQVQFNNNSSFGSSSNFTFDIASNTLAVTNLSVTTNSNSANVYANYINSSNYYSLAGDLNLYAGSGNSSISLTTTGNGTIDVNDTRITNLSTPQFDNDAATKKYVDDVAQGLNVHDSCKVATTANIATLSGGTVAYNNGASGVGANLVITGGSITTIDTYSLQNLDRILVKNEANLTWNGIYTWATGGTVLTRATDFNTPAEIEGGDFTFVTDGNVYQNTGWVQTDNVTTIGTDSIEWQQFSGAGTYEAGNGLSLTGTVFSVNVDNVTIEINSDVLRVKANAQFVTPDIDSATGNSLTLGGSGYIQAGNLVTANYFTGTLTTASQPNIISLGTLSNLSVTGNINSGNISSGNISGGNLVTANYFTGIITTTHQPYIESVGNLVGLTVSNVTGIVNFNTTANVSLGDISNLHILGGSSGYVLKTDGTGNLSWGIDTAAAGGSNRDVQFNDGGVLGGNTNFTFDKTTSILTLTGNIVTSNASLGNLVTANYVDVTANLSAGNVLTDNLMYANGQAWDLQLPGGSNTQLQFNDSNSFGASANLTFDKSTNILTLAGNILTNNANLGNLAQANYFSGTLTTAVQPNITSLGTLTGLLVNGVSNLGNISNVIITGGSAGYVLTTDGYGELSWEATSNSGPGFVSIRKDNFVANGVQTSFALTTVPNGEDAVEVNLNGLIQQGYVYDIVGSNVVFTSPPVSGANIEVTTFGALSITQSDEQVLFINGNSLAGTNNFTFNTTTNTLTATNLVATANVTAGNVKSDNLLYANGVPYNFATSAGGLNTQVQFNDSNNFAGSANFTFDKTTNTLSVTSIIANGSGITFITGSNVNGNVNNAIQSHYANIANSVDGSNVSGNVSWAITSNWANIANSVAGANVSGQVGNALIAGTVYINAQPNITSLGNLTSLVVSGNTTIAGNLTVSGNVNYINVDSLVVQDPIIEMGGGANGAPLTTNDGKDRGSLLHYYTTSPIDAFMGWDNSNGEFAFGSNVSVTNEVVTFNNLGNIRANYFIGDGSLLTNINASNLVGAYSNSNVANYLPTYTGNVSANYFIGNGATLTFITGSNVSGNVSSAVQSHYANIANSVSGANVSGNVNYAITSNWANVANSVSGSNVSGNVADAVHAYYADVANSVSGSNVSGNVSYAITSNYANTANAVSGSNVSGNVTDAIHAYYADVANSVSGANVSGNVNYAITSNYANIANSVAGSNVSGNVTDAIHAYYADTANSVAGANVTGQVANALIAGTVYTNAQPNITSIGTLTSLDVSGNAIITGNLTVSGTTEYINVTNLYVKDPIIEMGGGANGAPLTTDDGKDRGTLLHYYTTEPVNAFMGWDNSNGEFTFGSNVSVTNEVVTYNSLGNIRANYFIGDGSLLSNINAANIIGSYSNTNVAAYLPTYTGNLVSLTGAVTTTANITANYFIGNGSQLTGLPESYSNVNVAAYLPTYTGNVSANYFIGNGATLTNITGANIIGNVTWAITSNWANVANSVSGANVSGNVTDAIHAYYADIANSVSGSNVTGNVSYAITSNWANIANSVSGSNVSGNVADAVHAYYADVANSVSGSNVSGNVSYAITSNWANIANSVSGGNVSGQVSNALIAGTVYTNAQPNITSLGTLTSLTVNGSSDLGPVSNIAITGGIAGYVLTTNGSGDLSWQAAGGSTGPGFVNITKNSFTGNGVQTIFGLTTIPASEASLLVNIDGITQQDAAYSLSGSNVTFSSPPLSGEIVEIVSYGSISIGSNTTVLFNDNGNIGNVANFTFNKSSNTLNVTNIDTTSISFDAGLITVSGSNAGVFSSGIDNINLGLNSNVTIGSTLGNTNVQGNLIAGNISTVGNLVVSNTATITNLKVNDLYSNRTPVSVTTNTVVDSFSVNKYRSAKYTMRVNSDDGYQAVEVLLIHDGIDSYVTIYGSLSTIGTDIVTLFSNINSGNVRLLANTISANTTVNFVGTYVAD